MFQIGTRSARKPGHEAVWTLVAVAAAALACARPPATFVDGLAATINAHDVAAASERFAPDAEVIVVGGGPTLHGRAEIAEGLRFLMGRLDASRVALGRQFIGPDAAVIELCFTATGGRVGVMAAAVVTRDTSDRIVGARLYVDVPTLVGQVDPRRLPDGVRIRRPIAQPLAGGAVMTAGGTPAEAKNLAIAAASWDRLAAHDPAGVLASLAPGYSYDDLSGPAPLDEKGTRELLERFLAMVPDFTIAAKPTFFAAGDDVVTELIEHMTFRGRPVTLHGLDIKHLLGGRVIREWQYANGSEALEALLGVQVALELE